MDEREQVITELKALVKVPGALKIITSEQAKPTPIVNNRPVPPTDPRHFVLHDVVKLEGPDSRGRYIAHSGEGDYCTGQPDALLRRLREWRG